MHSAFYRFIALADPLAAAEVLRALARRESLLGSIVVAAEGVSGALAGEPQAVAAFEAAVQQSDVLLGVLNGMAFKHSACNGSPFGRLKVSVKPEIVALALPGAEALAPPNPQDASHLGAQAWRALLALHDVVLLDNRNHFEYRMGHFHGAVDPRVHNFRDFVAYVEAQAPAWRDQARPVAMYCTGGIRCDKTAPWLRSLGLQVWQLDGGILNFFQQVDDGARDWQGECFVFDQRIAVNSRLEPTGTTAEQVYDTQQPDEAWRLQRAQRLADTSR